MAKKTERKTYEIIDPHLGEVINAYLEAKRIKEDADKRMTECLEEIESYTDIDKNTDFNDKVIVRSGSVNVELEYKLNYKVDKDIAFEGCNRLGVDPLMLFNVDLKYAKSKFDKLTDEEKEVVAAATTTSRGKTGIKFN